MASNRNRILEPYGYREEDVFESNSCRCDEDIKGIKKVNEEQTDEINALLSGKADVDLVLALSAYTVSSVTRLDAEDQELWDALNDEISARTETDKELWEAINEGSSECEQKYQELSDLLEKERRERIATDDDIYSRLSGYSDAFDSLSGLIDTERQERMFNDGLLADRITDMEETFWSGLTDMNDALQKEIIARISGDTYLQKEIDALSGNVKDNTDLIKRLDDELNHEISGLNASVSSLTSSVDSLSGTVIQTQYTANNALDIATNLSNKVANIIVEMQEHRDDIDKNTDDIAKLKQAVEEADLELMKRISEVVSAHTKDIEELKAADEVLTKKLKKKANQVDLDTTNNNLAELSGKVLSDEVEIAELKGTVNAHTEHLGSIDNSIVNINTNITNIVQSAQTLSDGLAQEIIDRKEGDNAIIGDEDDLSSDITIYGTRKLIKNASGDTLAAANEYTDRQIEYALGEADKKDKALEDEFNSKLQDYATWSGVAETYATKEYVDQQDGEMLRESKAYSLQLYDEVVSGYHAADDALEKRVNHNATQIQHITEFDFVENPGLEYEDSGNGVLDVLHREFHKFTGATIVTSSLWESGTTPDVRAQVTDQTTEEKAPMIQIHNDGTFWLWIEEQWVCLNEILKGLVGETY